MELTKINELMFNRGYTRPIGPIFSEWEFVKDEILLPNRKAGSGNGTVHIYLLEENMQKFESCFPHYINAFRSSPTESEHICPHIDHFILTANVLTVAGFAYDHYRCDANVFHYSDFVSKIIKQDDNGMIKFESLFKLSTDDRPYFKQFDKTIFGKLIRYIFVPKITAYKLYLYSDDNYQNFATFWTIGQVVDNSYVINLQQVNKTENDAEVKSTNTKTKEATKKASKNTFKKHKATLKEKTEVISTTVELFYSYMLKKKKSVKTAKSYIGNLNNLIPRAQKMLDGLVHPSPLTITDLSTIEAIDNALWSNPKIVKWNRNEHNRASAALHMYISFLQDTDLSHTVLSTNQTPTITEDSTQSDNAYEEIEQIELYRKYLQNTRNSSEVTLTSYINALQKRLSKLIRDTYAPNFTSVFTLNDYAELIKLDSEIWDIPQIVAANESTRGKLHAAFKAYLEFVEQSLSDEELAAIAFN